ncbi:MAG: hypothetical protein AB7N91_15215 [Candidatus Tectimicrobiota bacterium]
MTHASADIWGYFGRPLPATAEFDKWLTISDVYVDEAGEVGGILQQEALPPLPRRSPARLQTFVQTQYRRTAFLGVFTADEPQVSNHVALRPDRGFRLRRVFSPADHARRLLRAAGARVTSETR